MSDAPDLLAQLHVRSPKRLRVPLDEIWAAFKTIRGYTGQVEARAHLASLLTELEAAGELRLPSRRNRKLWNRSVEPPLPTWAQLTRHRPTRERVDHRAIAWPPELAFVVDMARVPLFDELLAIRRFLAEGGRDARPVPRRERSLQVFGDEKRLDRLARTELFTTGQLGVDLLRCYDVPPPLVWRRGPGRARAGLVVENLHTYHSFGRWNEARGAYAFVGYGDGHAFKKTCLDLPGICEKLGCVEVEYFGDVDRAGLEIAVFAAKLLEGRGGPMLAPGQRWYAALLEFHARALDVEAPKAASESAIAWLPKHLQRSAREVLASGCRLPQEFIGLEFLMARSQELEPQEL